MKIHIKRDAASEYFVMFVDGYPPLILNSTDPFKALAEVRLQYPDAEIIVDEWEGK